MPYALGDLVVGLSKSRNEETADAPGELDHVPCQRKEIRF